MSIRQRLKDLIASRPGRRAAQVALSQEVRDRARDSLAAIRTALADGKIDTEEAMAVVDELGELRDAIRDAYHRAGGVS